MRDPSPNTTAVKLRKAQKSYSPFCISRLGLELCRVRILLDFRISICHGISSDTTVCRFRTIIYLAEENPDGNEFCRHREKVCGRGIAIVHFPPEPSGSSGCMKIY